MLLEFLPLVSRCFYWTFANGFVLDWFGLGIERLGPSFCLTSAYNRPRRMLPSILDSRDIALTAVFDCSAAAAPYLPIAL
jgi:hypothetical protein